MRRPQDCRPLNGWSVSRPRPPLGAVQQDICGSQAGVGRGKIGLKENCLPGSLHCVLITAHLDIGQGQTVMRRGIFGFEPDNLLRIFNALS